MDAKLRDLLSKLEEASDNPHLRSLSDRFLHSSYKGVAADRFLDYLKKCWSTYRNATIHYLHPFSAVVQSSGFGKSRLLKEIAQRTSKGTDIRLLYTCARSDVKSTVFPSPTDWLQHFFYPRITPENVDVMIRNLFVAFKYAMANWDSAGDTWTNLFHDRSLDKKVYNDFKAFEEGHIDQINAIYVHPSGMPITPKPLWDKRVLVLAIDEANALLVGKKRYDHIVHFMQDAVKRANITLALKYDRLKINAGIMVVFAGSDPRLADLQALHPSKFSRIDGKLFPPFTLTQTMNLRASEPSRGQSIMSFYQDLVIQSTVSYEDSVTWWNVINMGRPLWANAIDMKSIESQEVRISLVQYAAEKLMLENELKSPWIYSDDDRVMADASLILCRLGLRPASSSALAQHIATHSMGVLCFMSETHDQYVSYCSDPILTFGAANLWHGEDNKLSEFILPHFRNMLLKDVVDTDGNIGVVVARILLLLAMDACAIVPNRSGSALCWFYGVSQFLRILHGPKSTSSMQSEKAKDVVNAAWKDWRLGFSHFVELQVEPTEECLWYLLSRRAAGVFPKGRTEANLIIPIFTTGNRNEINAQVSMMLIRVNEHSIWSGRVDELDLGNFVPAKIFSSTNSLHSMRPDRVVRILMNLNRHTQSSRCYMVDPSQKISLDDPSALLSSILCLNGVGEWRDEAEKVAFVSRNVSVELMKLMVPPWDLSSRLETALMDRPAFRTNSRSILRDREMLEMVLYPVPLCIRQAGIDEIEVEELPALVEQKRGQYYRKPLGSKQKKKQ